MNRRCSRCGAIGRAHRRYLNANGYMVTHSWCRHCENVAAKKRHVKRILRGG